MKATVNYGEPEVVLRMTAQELAALARLHFKHGAGNPGGLRGEVERGLEEALNALPAPYRQTAKTFTSNLSGGSFSYNDVEAAFAKALT